MGVGPVRPGAAGRQATPAKWRGIVKIQPPLSPPDGDYLATSEDGAICVHLTPTKTLRKLLRSRERAFFRATLLGDGTLDIHQEAPETQTSFERGWDEWGAAVARGRRPRPRRRRRQMN